MGLRWWWTMPGWCHGVRNEGAGRGASLYSLLLVWIKRIPRAGRWTGTLYWCSDGGAAAATAATTWAVPGVGGNFGIGFQDGEVLLVLTTLTGWSLWLWSGSLGDYWLEEDYLGLLYNLNWWTEAPRLHRGGVITRLLTNEYIQKLMRPKHDTWSQAGYYETE